MKKIIIFLTCIIAVLTLSGCTMNNTPTKKVENFLDNYTSNNKTVLGQLKEMVDSDNYMNDTQKDKYQTIMKKQYKDMTYDIKDETIDGDNATVTAEIEVYDYYKVNKESTDYYNNNQSEFTDNNSVAEDIKEGVENAAEKTKEAVQDAANAISNSKFLDYRLDQLDNAKDRVKYTIDFTLRKENDKWVLNDIDDVTRQKIHGLYEH